eukprot:scaffold111_cov404-Prasinococcus_capsulatus_cf.AAC.13
MRRSSHGAPSSNKLPVWSRCCGWQACGACAAPRRAPLRRRSARLGPWLVCSPQQPACARPQRRRHRDCPVSVPTSTRPPPTARARWTRSRRAAVACLAAQCRCCAAPPGAYRQPSILPLCQACARSCTAKGQSGLSARGRCTRQVARPAHLQLLSNTSCTVSPSTGCSSSCAASTIAAAFKQPSCCSTSRTLLSNAEGLAPLARTRNRRAAAAAAGVRTRGAARAWHGGRRAAEQLGSMALVGWPPLVLVPGAATHKPQRNNERRSSAPAAGTPAMRCAPGRASARHLAASLLLRLRAAVSGASPPAGSFVRPPTHSGGLAPAPPSTCRSLIQPPAA